MRAHPHSTAHSLTLRPFVGLCEAADRIRLLRYHLREVSTRQQSCHVRRCTQSASHLHYSTSGWRSSVRTPSNAVAGVQSAGCKIESLGNPGHIVDGLVLVLVEHFLCGWICLPGSRGRAMPTMAGGRVRMLSKESKKWFSTNDLGSIPGRVTPGFSHAGIGPDDATGRRVFSGISRFPRPLIGSQELPVTSCPNLFTHSRRFHAGAAVAQWLAQLVSHQGDPGSIPGGLTPGFSHVGVVLDDAACRRAFSGNSSFPRPCIPAPLHPRVSFHVMFRDDGNLRVPAGKRVTRDSSDLAPGQSAAAPSAFESPTASPLALVAPPTLLTPPRVLVMDSDWSPPCPILNIEERKRIRRGAIFRHLPTWRYFPTFEVCEARGAVRAILQHVSSGPSPLAQGSELTCSVLVALRVSMMSNAHWLSAVAQDGNDWAIASSRSCRTPASGISHEQQSSKTSSYSLVRTTTTDEEQKTNTEFRKMKSLRSRRAGEQTVFCPLFVSRESENFGGAKQRDFATEL
ncbi:hypothetical protein PR048_033313 [Dryococelus australis]|uniref:Uncharacterized protein n=1 Tax=Dryococelus australis TaxID=614101 RepID=A0ABQ9FZY2_9NEOP|nr:hypothetical protein PR048_033313 [Dryococelus australis]